MNKNKSEKGKILALASISVCIIAVAIAGATGVSEAVEATSTPLSGELAIAGSTTVLPINQECARLLVDENPGLIISVSGGGSGHGVKAVGTGEIDIGAASRDIKSKEWEKYPDLKPVAIGKDSVAIVVHPNNDVSDLTIENVSKIFAGEIKNWKELGGADAPIRIITREEGSGTREVFEKYVMKPFGREIAEEASVKSSNGVVRATVGRDESSIGFLSLGYVDPSVKALKIDGVEATVKNVLSGDYPIVRTLYLITKGEPEPLEEAFIDFVLSEEGQKVVEDSGYIKLAGAPKRNIITILHTNDVHAHLDNIARRATAVQEVRDEVGADNAFLLDAGDVFTGTLYFSLYRGMADMEFMNMLGYDSMCLGNHEFDNFATRPEDLTNFVDNASFPILSANFNFSDEQKLAGKIEPWVIIEKGGEQYGIFGLTTEDTAVISSPGESITINDHTATAEEVVAALEDQGINKIIALTHLGWNEDIALAQEVEGIDIIVGGHSDTVPDPYPTVINGDEPVIVVQAGGHGEYLGRLDVTFDADGVVQTYGGELLEVEMFDEDPEYAAKLAEYQEAIEELMETVVGETLVDLDGERAHVRTRETNLGNLITDAMLAKASCVNATIAIQNGGGIRASIPAGNITLGKLMEVQPFGNYLVAFNLSGEQIIAALENGVSKVEEVSGRFPQVAGLRYTWDPSKNREERVISVEVKTATDAYQPIDHSASYRIVTNNFLYSGGDGYMMFQNGTDFVLLGFVDYEVLREYIEENSPVSPEVEGRIFEGQHHFIELTDEWQEMGLDLNDLEPEFIATTPDGRGALITIQEGNAVAVVNPSKLIKIIELPNEAEPDGIDISPDGKIAVTANEEGQSISLIDLSQGLAMAELTNTIDVLQFLPMDDPDFKHDEGEVDPEGVAIFNKEGRNYAVLALEKSASLLVLDVTDPDDVTPVSLLPVGISGDEQNPDDRVAEPEGVAISPQGNLIAVGNEEEGTVSLIPILNGGVPSFGERSNFNPSGKEAEIVAFTPDQKNLLVTNSKENTLIILNISDLTEIKEKRVIDLSSYGEPTSVAVSPNGEYALVSIADGVNPTVNPGRVVAINLLPQGQNEIFAEFSVGQVPDSLGITPDGNYALIANEAENEEDIFEDDEIVGSISVINLAGLDTTVATEELIFVHMTDVHLCDADFAESYYGASAGVDPPAFFNETINEIRSINPDFVVDTGDLVAAVDNFGPEIAEGWFTLYKNSIQRLADAGIDVHVVVGNHDVVGVNNRSVNITEPGYGKEMFRTYFGANNYSFDEGGYHFVVLNSNNIGERWGMPGKGLYYAIEEPQLSWLENDLSSTSNPSIVFLHEPTLTLENSDEVWEILSEHNTIAIFSGHWHDEELLNSSGIPEQVTGAVCGGWWRGPNKDGVAQGYRIVVMDGTEINTFYKATGEDRQINILNPSEPIANGTVEVEAKIYSNSPVTAASYRVDGGDATLMTLSEEGLWYVSEALWDTDGLTTGYHTIEVFATDADGDFSEDMQIKVSDDKIASIGEVKSHLDVYLGKYPTIEGTVTAAFYGEKLPVIQDATAGIPIWAGDIGQAPPTFAPGEVWSIRGQLIEYANTHELALINSEDATKLGEATIPEPELRKASEIDESTEGLLVMLKNCTVISKDYSGFTIQDDSGGKVYVYGGYARYDTSAINAGDKVDVIGLGWQYKDMYEVCLRTASDVIPQ